MIGKKLQLSFRLSGKRWGIWIVENLERKTSLSPQHTIPYERKAEAQRAHLFEPATVLQMTRNQPNFGTQ